MKGASSLVITYKTVTPQRELMSLAHPFVRDIFYSILVITSSCGFSAHFFRSDIVILVLCTLGVEVQGESDGLSMECVSQLFSGI